MDEVKRAALELLRSGRERVATKWEQDRWQTPEGGVCALGALGCTSYANAKGRWTDFPVWRLAMAALASNLPPTLFYGSRTPLEQVVWFNDNSTHECVVELFDRAVASLESQQ